MCAPIYSSISFTCFPYRTRQSFIIIIIIIDNDNLSLGPSAQSLYENGDERSNKMNSKLMKTQQIDGCHLLQNELKSKIQQQQTSHSRRENDDWRESSVIRNERLCREKQKHNKTTKSSIITPIFGQNISQANTESRPTKKYLNSKLSSKKRKIGDIIRSSTGRGKKIRAALQIAKRETKSRAR